MRVRSALKLVRCERHLAPESFGRAAAAVGVGGAATTLGLGTAAPALLCADASVRAALRATAPLGAATALLGALNHGLYGVFIGLGWLGPFLAAQSCAALVGLALFAAVPAGGGPAALLQVWRAIVAFSAIKVGLGLVQLPRLLARTLPPTGAPGAADRAPGARAADAEPEAGEAPLAKAVDAALE